MQPHPCPTTPWGSTTHTFVGGAIREYNNQRLMAKDDAALGMVLPRPDEENDMTC